MAAIDAALRRAFAQLRNGSATVWVPDVTTGQLARLPAMQALAAGNVRSSARAYHSDLYFVDYDADALPDAATPAWTKVEAGSPAASVSSSLLSLVTDAASESIYYVLAEAGLSNARGTMVEARLRVNSSTATANEGAALSIRDGTHQFTAWLRAGGLNIEGGSDLACTLSTGLHVVRFTARGDACRLYVDGNLRAMGTSCGDTADQEVSFGSYAEGTQTPAQSSSDWDFVRAMIGGF